MSMRFLPKNIPYDHSLLLHFDGVSIRQVDHTCFLGLEMDHKLTWSYHVDKLCCKLASSTFLMRSLRDTVTPEVLRFAYFGLVQSILSHGLMFWGPVADFGRA